MYEPISYFDENDPPIFLWYGGRDAQVPPVTVENFLPLLNEDKDLVIFSPNGQHNPNEQELEKAYAEIFIFLDNLRKE